MKAHGEATEGLIREFSLRDAFSLAFAFISPIVGLYSIFALGLAAAGPSFWFGFPIVLAGQVLVALVFGMLASRWPLEGSVYQWSKHLVGHRYAWFTGWAYAWALPMAMAAVAIGGAGFLADLLGLDSHSVPLTAGLALGLLGFATWGNTHGRSILNTIVGLCILAEIVGSVGVAIVLLLTHRVHPLSVLLSTPHLFDTPRSVPALFASPLCAATAIAGWAFLGFESAGSIGEEVRDPSRAIPRAMLLSLVSVASVVALTALAMILAMPDLEAVVAGRVADPVAATLGAYFGRIGMKFVLGVFMVGFIAGILSMQASVSRVIWAFARDRELPGSRWIQVLSPTDRLPVNAIYVATAMSLVLFGLSFTSVYTTVVAFTAGGFYIAFAFPILAAAWVRATGRWQQTPFDLGIATGPVIYGAAGWIVFQTVNIAWPRDVGAPWYERWGVLVMVVLLGVIGVLVRMSVDRARGKDTDNGR